MATDDSTTHYLARQSKFEKIGNDSNLCSLLSKTASVASLVTRAKAGVELPCLCRKISYIDMEYEIDRL